MIGGTDIMIPTLGGGSALDFALRAVLHKWPTAVFENAETGERYDTYEQLPCGQMKEVFAYKDTAARDKWEELGADESLVGTMLHVLRSESSVTIVVDSNPPLEITSLVDAIRDGLRHGVFCFPRRVAA